MTCKDCVHYEVCEDVRYGDIADCPINRCGGFFKNKADFVEVVRCEDCKYYYTYYHRCQRDELHIKMKCDDYCRYGRRKDAE